MPRRTCGAASGGGERWGVGQGTGQGRAKMLLALLVATYGLRFRQWEEWKGGTGPDDGLAASTCSHVAAGTCCTQQPRKLGPHSCK